MRFLAAPLAIVLALTMLSVATGGQMARAQEAADAPHPAHIHTGSCADLGEIVAPLTDVTLQTAGEAFGAAAAVPVEESETTVDLSLGDILAAPHAVNIHQSADAIQVYIACGDIGGRVVDGQLSIGLQELNGSGYYGVATLTTEGDKTRVMVFLADQSEAGGEQAAAAPTQAAAPTEAAPATAAPEETVAAEAPTATEAPAAAETPAAAATAQDVPVDIRDFAFSPTPVEIAVGDTVTWTNQDQVPHTATSDIRDVFQSGAISPGSSFSHTFTTAGEFAYHCEFHPNMMGTVVVK